MGVPARPTATSGYSLQYHYIDLEHANLPYAPPATGGSTSRVWNVVSISAAVMTPVPLPVLALIALLGLAIGSFLNVVIYRVPRGESIVSPGSHCPRCDDAIKSRHNVPVLGWLMLRGRCASCALPISVAVPVRRGWSPRR